MSPKTIAAAAGIDTRETRFAKASSGEIYAVYFESINNIGPDLCPSMLTACTATIELYSKKANNAARAAAIALEKELNAYNLEWSKGDQIWIEEEQIFQTVYSYTYLQKG